MTPTVEILPVQSPNRAVGMTSIWPKNVSAGEQFYALKN
jgi:hypothetical protein